MPVRIQRKREKGWRKPANCRCVTRPGVFGNPFTTAEYFRWWLEQNAVVVSGLTWGWLPLTPEMAKRLDRLREIILARLPELKGLDLACYCDPDADCHADVLLELANESEGEK
jgi:hypothetical protein